MEKMKFLSRFHLKNSGTSLVELLVTTVVAGIIFSSAMGSYFVFAKSTQKMNIWREIQKETHFSMIRMADKIRSNSIDFPAYISGNCVIDTNRNLCLSDNNFFEFKNENIEMNGAPLFSKQFKVERIKFQISPEKDPFTNITQKELQIQPKVEIQIEISSRRDPKINFAIRTTISSRLYK
jgi:hypothetical protein